MKKKLMILGIMIASVTSMQAALFDLGGTPKAKTSTSPGVSGSGTGMPTRLQGTGTGATHVKPGPKALTGSTTPTVVTTDPVATSLTTVQGTKQGHARVDLTFDENVPNKATAPVSNDSSDASNSLTSTFKSLMRPVVAAPRKIATGRSGLSNRNTKKVRTSSSKTSRTSKRKTK